KICASATPPRLPSIPPSRSHRRQGPESRSPPSRDPRPRPLGCPPARPFPAPSSLRPPSQDTEQPPTMDLDLMPLCYESTKPPERSQPAPVPQLPKLPIDRLPPGALGKVLERLPHRIPRAIVEPPHGSSSRRPDPQSPLASKPDGVGCHLPPRRFTYPATSRALTDRSRAS